MKRVAKMPGEPERDTRLIIELQGDRREYLVSLGCAAVLTGLWPLLWLVEFVLRRMGYALLRDSPYISANAAAIEWVLIPAVAAAIIGGLLVTLRTCRTDGWDLRGIFGFAVGYAVGPAALTALSAGVYHLMTGDWWEMGAWVTSYWPTVLLCWGMGCLCGFFGCSRAASRCRNRHRHPREPADTDVP